MLVVLLVSVVTCVDCLSQTRDILILLTDGDVVDHRCMACRCRCSSLLINLSIALNLFGLAAVAGALKARMKIVLIVIFVDRQRIFINRVETSSTMAYSNWTDVVHSMVNISSWKLIEMKMVYM